ncbi:MAG: alpha/beta hydrolase [Methanomicrobiaceae archaeon]|nr:alpha/beta hydrolase [Methanomicrobiaceae archaeon]
MTALRRYGAAPYAVAVVHGGPGAAGEMAPVARALSFRRGVLEPLQQAATLEGQVQELAGVLEEHAACPATLVGHSWGAWLAFIAAARYPALAAKVVLIGSGPFEERYAPLVQNTRLSRLEDSERKEALSLMRALGDSGGAAPAALARLGEVLSSADHLDPLPGGGEACELRPDIFCRVWGEAERLRRSGELLALGERICCPVVAIHGDYDPHPAEGVAAPLSRVLADFRFITLEACGHTPWRERRARERFFAVLEAELPL